MEVSVIVNFSINRLREITKELFEKMIGLALTESDEKYEDAFAAAKKEISAFVGMSGENPGILAVHTSKILAAKITAAMLGMDEKDMADGDVNDGFGEIGNIIAGNIKKEFEKQKMNIKLSLPTVVTGQDYSTRILNGEKTDEVKIRVINQVANERMFVEFIFQGEINVE
jgi:chemotaxis protein CheX